MSKNKILKKSWQDAKANIKRNNFLLLAVAFLLGAVTNAMISSFANDVVLSYIVNAFGIKNLQEWKLENGILIGKFLGTVIQFAIVMVLLFVVLFLFFVIKNNYVEHKNRKNPPQPVVKPLTIDELILKELQQLNSNITKNQLSQDMQTSLSALETSARKTKSRSASSKKLNKK